MRASPIKRGSTSSNGRGTSPHGNGGPEARIGCTVLSGEHFPKSDLFGKCDAYCKIKYGKKVLLCTQVCKNTYEPVWNESVVITVETMNSLIIECMEGVKVIKQGMIVFYKKSQKNHPTKCGSNQIC